MSYRVLSFTPTTNTMTYDVMCGSKWLGQMKFLCSPGKQYSYDMLKALAIERKPSLKSEDFDLVPTAQVV